MNNLKQITKQIPRIEDTLVDYNIKLKKKQRAEYRKKNKDKIAKQQAEYYKKNKDKIAKQQAEYYKKNKRERMRDAWEKGEK